MKKEAREWSFGFVFQKRIELYQAPAWLCLSIRNP